MRPNRYIVLISLLLGVAGAWLSADAVGQYLNAARSFASVNATYVDGSFAWEDPQYERATAQFEIVNDSDNDARLVHFSINLYFDGRFAGARYAPWDAIDIPAGSSVTVDIPFLVSISELRPEGGDAELSVSGQLRLEFENVGRDMTVPARGTIGHVPYQESDND
jgi:hypothetical protein